MTLIKALIAKGVTVIPKYQYDLLTKWMSPAQVNKWKAPIVDKWSAKKAGG